MTLQIAIVKEKTPNERRVALTPETLNKKNMSFLLEKDAGVNAGFANENFEATLVEKRSKLLQQANIVVTVQGLQANDIKSLQQETIIIGMLDQQDDQSALIDAMCEKKITSFDLQKMPRIARAQSMDVLSSQANVAGYKAALLAANLCERFFPMLTTAAGTVRPAKVMVVGAGVAGLQAIATCHRLGAIVKAYDIRPEAREQIESLEATMIDLGVTIQDEKQTGYARELTEEEKNNQQQKLAQHVANSDIAIATAAVPGKPAPTIITESMVAQMSAGSAIIDLAAPMGGNCELTELGKTINYKGVLIAGPINLPSEMAHAASELYAKNIMNFLSLLIDEQGTLNLNWEDPIIKGCLVTYAGKKC